MAPNTSNSGEDLLGELPRWMPTEEGTGNFKLLDTVGRSIDDLDEDVEEIDRASTVQDADTIPQIEMLASMVDRPPKQGEGIGKYRSRVIARFQHNTNDGTAPEIINDIAVILSIEPTDVVYEKDGHGVVEISVPSTSLSNLNISSSEFADIVGDLVAAGFQLRPVKRGTLLYVTPTEYQNDNYDPEQGYDGLDSNGDPKQSGGTYSGIIQ